MRIVELHDHEMAEGIVPERVLGKLRLPHGVIERAPVRAAEVEEEVLLLLEGLGLRGLVVLVPDQDLVSLLDLLLQRLESSSSAQAVEVGLHLDRVEIVEARGDRPGQIGQRGSDSFASRALSPGARRGASTRGGKVADGRMP